MGYVVLFPKVMVAGFNSTRLVNPEKRNFGYVGYDQIHAMLESAWKTESASMGGRLRIAALHHHLLPVSDVPIPTARFDQPERDLTITFDAPRTLKALREYNFAVVMHGHMHEPFFQPSEESNALLRQPGNNSRMYVSGAGTICFTPCEVHQFQVLEVRRGKLTVHQLHTDGQSTERSRPWRYHRLDEKLAPVKEYEPPSEAVQKLRRSEARQAETSFGQHESAWDLMAALRKQASAGDRLWRLVWKSWPLLYPGADAIAPRRLFVTVTEEFRKDPERAIAQFRARLGTPEAVFAHEYILEKMIELYRRSRGTA
ncbi:MAG TPA: hypothetical protein VHW24_26100 [Bryobacteraceae bacterium]|jgi:hypothetical protein|nr:hypothetical protein [Bryobacteraceae bacterium]